jgi:hypothetical protein
MSLDKNNSQVKEELQEHDSSLAPTSSDNSQERIHDEVSFDYLLIEL